MGDAELVPEDRSAFGRRILPLHVALGPELHGMEVLRQLLLRDVVIVDELGVHIELVVVVGAEAAGRELRIRDVALLSGRNDGERPHWVRDLRRRRLGTGDSRPDCSAQQAGYDDQKRGSTQHGASAVWSG